MVRGKWLAAGGAVLALALVAATITLTRMRPARAKTAAPPPLAILREIDLAGRVQAKTIVNIPAPSDGIIERFMADVGEDVFEGELLAKIKNAKLDTMAQTAEADASRAQARVADLESALLAARLEASRARADATRTKAELDRAEKSYQRQKLLQSEGATPRLVFEKAEADYLKLKADAGSFDHLASAAEDRIASLSKELEAAKTLAQSKSEELDEAKADLGAGEVHSTADGVVIARHGQAGEQVSRQVQDLFQIGTQLGTLEVVALPDARFLDKIKAGQDALIQIAEAPGAISGKVREVKGGQVIVEFASPLPAIRPGLTAQVKLRLS